MTKTYILIEVTETDHPSGTTHRAGGVRRLVHEHFGEFTRDFVVHEPTYGGAIQHYLREEGLTGLRATLEEAFKIVFDKDAWRRHGFRFKGDPL